MRVTIDQVLATRSYDVLHRCVDEQLADAVANEPHQLAVVAPSSSDDALAYARAYREKAKLARVRIVVCAPESVADKAKALGDHVVTVRPRGEEPLDRDELVDALDHATRHLLTIMVADDEPLIRRMFEMYFSNEGYNVVTAEDGEEAVAKVKEVSPDLLITDIQMPGVNGYEVCRSVKETRETQHIPVIIVSALGNEVDINKGFNAGANEYVTKPVDLPELSGRIQNIFRAIAHRGREKILVISPSRIERSLLDYGLTQQGFEVYAASTGEQALELIHKRPPSAIVSDVNIPGLSLRDLRERLRQSRATRDVPLVVLTQAAAKIDRDTRDAVRAAAYVTKPFPMERLAVCIERILGERRSNLELEREILLQSIRGLINTLEARDSYTSGHSENVARYTRLIALKAFSSQEEIKRFELSAQLHDIGKIGVADAILLKPGRLTEEEWRVMKTHPTVGADILAPIQSLQDILPGVRYHHERIDGNGYPEGLGGDDVPLQARMIAVADTFDALTSSRPYRKGCSVEKAMSILRDVAGTQLDADLVRIFAEVVEEQLVSQPLPPAPTTGHVSTVKIQTLTG